MRNEVPSDVDKFVIIAAPHTSNWDLPVSLAIAAVTDLNFYWVGKHTLFQPPFGNFMRRLGGIPVDRRKRQNFTEQVAEAFEEHDQMALAIAPEGTRSKRDHWKSGFYYIARAAQVPIVMGFVDWGKRECGLGPMVDASRPLDEVMDEIRSFYADISGKIPEDFTKPRLRTKPPSNSGDSKKNIL